MPGRSVCRGGPCAGAVRAPGRVTGRALVARLDGGVWQHAQQVEDEPDCGDARVEHAEARPPAHVRDEGA
eukprot:1250817-Prymnesium_polylepis.1